MSSSIRPVTRCFPNSKSLWDDSALPMCVVLTPLEERENETTSTDQATELKQLLRCLDCGAPHPTKDTFVEVEDKLFCHLCGELFSPLFSDQMIVRPNDSLETVEDQENWPLFNTESKNDFEVNLPLYNDPSRSDLGVAAKLCPPVWWIVLDATMPQSSPYWKMATSALKDILDDAPSYVHVGLIFASHDTISTWDLTSPVPRVSHYPLNTATGNTHSKYDTESIQVDFALVPMDSLHKPCVEAALRAVADNPSLYSSATPEKGMALGATCETILEFMEQAKHPGDVVAGKESNDGDSNGESTPTLKYAGGKITFLLGRPPQEIKRLDVEPQESFGLGGIGGAIHNPYSSEGSKKWSADEDETSTEDPSDLTPTNLAKFCEPLTPTEDVFDTIGTRCAHAALGVDVMIVEASEFLRPYYGIPLLRVLSGSSGAPGPLLIKSTDDLKNQVHARAPWQPGMGFSTEVYVRITPGWSIDAKPLDTIRKLKFQLAGFLNSGGMAGPVISTAANRFLMGTCDSHTSITMDLQVTNRRGKVNINKKVAGLVRMLGRKVTIEPHIQTCVAYTCVDIKEGRAMVMRKMRVSSRPMPVVDQMETIYDSIDPEALATALNQKFALNVYEQGLYSTQQLGIDWLRLLLHSVYKSALEQLEKENGKSVGMIQGDDKDGAPFDRENRLLMSNSQQIMKLESGSKKGKNTKSELEVDDVLLGYGHDKIAALPLIVYSLMQSDAFRPNKYVSVDARCAAIAQMESMTPSCLGKCIAPSLQLWSAKDDTIVQETVDLSLKNAVKAIKASGDEDNCIFILDSPQQALQYKANLALKFKTFKLALKSYKPTTPNLTALMEEMVNQTYRTVPYSNNDESEETSYKGFVHSMIEDYPTTQTLEFQGCKNFEDWKKEMAELIQADLEESKLI